MDFIINSLSYVLGLLMDVFFRGLTLIGYPRLWACIVLYAVVTRLFFLPDRINNHKRKLLAPVIKKDLLAVDPSFFEKTKDKELTIKRAALKKEVNKKYKLSNRSGCLTSLIQYPFLVALFYVVKNPQEFVPSLEALTNASPQVNTFLSIPLSAIPLNNITFDKIEGFVLFVPLIIAISNVAKMFPTIKNANNILSKIISCSLCVLFTSLIAWISATLPIAISLYWLVGDLTYMVFDFFIHRYLPKDKVISTILKHYNEEKEREEFLREEAESNSKEAASSHNIANEESLQSQTGT